MILQASALQHGAILDADVCIIGGGAAGLTTACELDASGLDVVVLEAGGRTFDPAVQDGLRGDVAAGSRHSPPDMYRRLVLGGATTIWGGRCVPLDPLDLEWRDYVPHSGWPIRWEELRAYYPRAQTYCEAGAFAYGVADALGGAAAPLIEGFADPDVMTSSVERFSPPTDFGRVHGARLARSSNVRVVLNAPVVRLVTQDSAVTAVEVAVAPGRRFSVRSRCFVVASGGLEVPRLLLASDRTRRGGLGNDGGALGRYYMCHLEQTLGRLHLTPTRRPVRLQFERTADGVYVRRKFAISPDAQRREGLLNTAFRLHYPLIADPSHGSGILSAMYLVKDAILPEYRRKLATVEIAGRARMSRDGRFWFGHMANVLRDAPAVTRFGGDWLRRRTFAARKLPFVVLPSRDGCYPLDVNAEQVPNPQSRLRLADELDVNGVRRVLIDWQLAQQDVDSLVRTAHLMRYAFARSGCASLELEDPLLEEQIRAATPVGGHHLGTARMSESPRNGVVDADCAVHGMANLFVAGGAVFPTCGHANPTLTIVALAIRLAEHLKAGASRMPAPVGARVPEPVL